jgi:hypothetical protein
VTETAVAGRSIADAIRLGWTVAEARGRNWPHGPRPTATELPPAPGDVLPLRSQRTGCASRRESVSSLVSLARSFGLERGTALEDDLARALPSFDDAGDAGLRDDGTDVVTPQWRATAQCFLDWDARFQDDLTRIGEELANGYLLGRGMAECYWGLGPERSWTADGADTGASLAFLLGEDRRRELTRMLGRLDPGVIHSFSAAGISGSLEAWGDVAADRARSRDPQMRDLLYQQVRQWYQLLIFGQDPTTLIRPYAHLTSTRYMARAVRVFWPQLVLALLALAVVTGFVVLAGPSGTEWLTPLLATSGLGAFAAAWLLARGQSAAQRLITRMRQDAYTDLVAISVAIVPEFGPAGGASAARRAKAQLEQAVRRRLITPATSPPPS